MTELIVLRRKVPGQLLVLIAIVLFGGILRLVGLNFGAPLAIKADEPIIIYNILYMFENRTFEPDTFQWPGHLLMELGYLAATFYSYVFLGLQPEAAIEIYPEEVWYPAVRFVSALFGIAAIVLAYFIGKFFGVRAGLIAAALFAFFPYYVEHSHYSTVDMGLTTLVMAVVLSSMHYLKRPDLMQVAIMGILSGASFTMKYPGALTTLVIATVILVDGVRNKLWLRIVGHGFVALFWFGLSAFLISPALFTNRHELIRSISNESKTQHPGADGRDFLERVDFYLSSYVHASGFLLIIPLVVGLALIFRKRLTIATPIFFGFFYWIALSSLALFWLRWGLPMFIAPLIITAVGIDQIFTWAKGSNLRIKTLAIASLSALATISLVSSGMSETARFLAKDTRVESLPFFESYEISASSAIYEGYSPLDAGTLGKVFTQFTSQNGEVVPIDESKEYLVLSSGTYGRFFNDSKFVEERIFYEKIESQYPEIYRLEDNLYVNSSMWEPINIVERAKTIFSILDGGVSGPTIRVLEIR